MACRRLRGSPQTGSDEWHSAGSTSHPAIQTRANHASSDSDQGSLHSQVTAYRIPTHLAFGPSGPRHFSPLDPRIRAFGPLNPTLLEGPDDSAIDPVNNAFSNTPEPAIYGQTDTTFAGTFPATTHSPTPCNTTYESPVTQATCTIINWTFAQTGLETFSA